MYQCSLIIFSVLLVCRWNRFESHAPPLSDKVAHYFLNKKKTCFPVSLQKLKLQIENTLMEKHQPPPPKKSNLSQKACERWYLGGFIKAYFTKVQIFPLHLKIRLMWLWAWKAPQELLSHLINYQKLSRSKSQNVTFQKWLIRGRSDVSEVCLSSKAFGFDSECSFDSEKKSFLEWLNVKWENTFLLHDITFRHFANVCCSHFKNVAYVLHESVLETWLMWGHRKEPLTLMYRFRVVEVVVVSSFCFILGLMHWGCAGYNPMLASVSGITKVILCGCQYFWGGSTTGKELQSPNAWTSIVP